MKIPWYDMSEDQPANGETVWCRRLGPYTSPFKAVWNASTREFTSSDFGLVLPWYMISRWRTLTGTPGPTSLDLSDWDSSGLAYVLFSQPFSGTQAFDDNFYHFIVNSEFYVPSYVYGKAGPPNVVELTSGGSHNESDLVRVIYTGGDPDSVFADASRVPEFDFQGVAP